MKSNTVKQSNVKQSPAAKTAPAKTVAAETAPAPAPAKVPPMFRRIDWLALVIAFLGVWAVYLWTLAPEQTLEDSGELCTGSFYAGVPHPPGYPFWSIYSWAWTAILGVLHLGNVAWRVEVGESFAAAMGCGLLALMVSRGSSMLIEGIEELKTISKQWENAICIVSGTVAGLLLGLGAFMWKESDVINRISLFGVPWLLAVVLLLMRWGYAPQQRRYLYLAMLFYGWLATIHQSLLVSAPGIEILLALMLPRLGRDLFFTNSVIFILILFFKSTGNIPALSAMTDIENALFYVVGIGSIAATVWLVKKTKKLGTEWKTVVMMGVMWVIGVMVYLYEPITCMTDPPMQWGYPRTVEGFFHTLSRGQYNSDQGTNVFQNPSQFFFQLFYLAEGLSESFTWAFLFVGLIPFAFLMKMRKRERNWIIGLAAIYFWIAVVLVIMLNVNSDRMNFELNKVFFTASHAIFAMLIGYGITILAAYVATHYEKIRNWCFAGAGVALVLASYCLINAIGKLYDGPTGQLKVGWLPGANWGGWGFLAFGPGGQFSIFSIPHDIIRAFAPGQYGLPVFANLILIALPIIFLAALAIYRKHGPVAILLTLFAITPFASGLEHWAECEQRNHWFGFWYGHDMFSPPFSDNGQLSYDPARRAELLKDPVQGKLTYPEMTRSAILFGGTDPGRFCPTYAIFCDSFIPHACQPKQDQHFDRRDCYIITQNALADGTYLDYLRAQYFRSQQQDPPFFSELSKYVFSLGVHSWRTATGSAFDKEDSQRENEHDMDVASHGLYGLVNDTLYHTLDVPFLKWGKHVETYRRAEGVYPPNEIYIPSPNDLQNSFSSYAADYQQRLQANQLMPGESAQVDANGRMALNEVGVMAINGLLCKVIFDNNPTNEFFVEESFALPWMYPYETPFGIIMKINREPQAQLTRDVFERDHKFWTDYSRRLCGNWITYDTSVQQIVDFVHRTYIQNNRAGYTGDYTFLRDEDAKKGFCKLRTAQAGMYAWRCSPSCPPEYREKSPELQEDLRRETDFAFKQAFAFCPYSQETISRYINFLLQYGRIDDAILVAKTCLELDPYNGGVADTVNRLEQFKQQAGFQNQSGNQSTVPSQPSASQKVSVQAMVDRARTNPGDYQNVFSLAGYYMQNGQTNRASELLAQAVSRTDIPSGALRAAAQYFAQTGNAAELETVLQKLAAAEPGQPEPWFDLARIEAVLGKHDQAMKALRTCLDLNDRRHKANPTAENLRDHIGSETAFNSLRGTPDFQKLISP